MGEWDSFTAEVEAASGSRKPGCTVGAYLKSLTREAREAIEAALGREELKTAAIARAMQDRGATISEFTVRRHRKGACTCDKIGT